MLNLPRTLTQGFLSTLTSNQLKCTTCLIWGFAKVEIIAHGGPGYEDKEKKGVFYTSQACYVPALAIMYLYIISCYINLMR